MRLRVLAAQELLARALFLGCSVFTFQFPKTGRVAVVSHIAKAKQALS